ncbi:DUF4062 domain-containing protein, partial [Methanocalculus sp.]|uniref:DUF4062 domain-containing protein n=1 Tax=Methanocalculus sp. TaxID=2004547 RepID=UPI00260485E7
MKSIFVSSTYGDLKQERDIAIKAIDSLESAKAIAMERFPADPNPPKEVCLSELRNCDAIVLIFGFAYGSVDADEEISITEIEYNEAKNNNIPVFVFIKQNSEGKWETNEESDDIKEKIKHFKGRIESERWRETFQTPYELAWKISMTLHNYEAENGEIGIKNPQFFKGEEFFRSCSRDNVLFSHIHPLIGRQKIFQDICDFLNSDKQILLIHGRGGIGKSKILFEFYKKIIDESEYKLWFLRDNAQFTADSFRQIPKNKRNVIIVDDAHRQNNLADLLNIISDNRQNIKLILSSRNYGVNYLKSQAIRSGFEPCEIDTLPELDTLKREEMEELADSLLDT